MLSFAGLASVEESTAAQWRAPMDRLHAGMTRAPIETVAAVHTQDTASRIVGTATAGAIVRVVVASDMRDRAKARL